MFLINVSSKSQNVDTQHNSKMFSDNTHSNYGCSMVRFRYSQRLAEVREGLRFRFNAESFNHNVIRVTNISSRAQVLYAHMLY